MELEPKPNQFTWHSDARGDYVIFKDGDWEFASYADNTLMYLFPDRSGMDHIFCVESASNGRMNGKAIWRRQVDELFGEGSFGRLCDQMFDRGFEHAPDEEPSETDYAGYLETFGESYRQVVSSLIDKLVDREMINFDAKWAFYSEEWS